MGIILPPFYFNNLSTNLTGTPNDVTRPGTSFTQGLSNADGTAVSILSALAHDVHYLVLGIYCEGLSAGDTGTLADILVDPAGGSSWSELISDLLIGAATTSLNGGTTSCTYYFHFPIFVKSGSSLGIRARTASAAAVDGGEVVVWAYGNPSRPEAWWCGQKVESLGLTPSTSKGTDITSGNSGSFGSWTTVGTSGNSFGAVQFGLQCSLTTMTDDLAYHFQIGYGSVQLVGSPTFWHTSSDAEFTKKIGYNTPIFCDVPASTAWQVRGTCSGTAQTMNTAIYGVY